MVFLLLGLTCCRFIIVVLQFPKFSIHVYKSKPVDFINRNIINYCDGLNYFTTVCLKFIQGVIQVNIVFGHYGLNVNCILVPHFFFVLILFFLLSESMIVVKTYRVSFLEYL